MILEKRAKQLNESPGFNCLLDKAQEWCVQFRIMVIGGQAVLGYCGRIRTSKDIDFVSPISDIGLLTSLLTECGFDHETSTFGLRCKRPINGGWEIIHISLGDIIDESRGHDRVIRYPVNDDLYDEAVEIPLQGITDDVKILPTAPVLPLEDLIITKLLPVGRTTDMEDVVLLIVTHVDQISIELIVEKISSGNELKKVIRERLEDLAAFVRQQQIGQIWLGRQWTPTEQKKVLKFIREFDSSIRH